MDSDHMMLLNRLKSTSYRVIDFFRIPSLRFLLGIRSPSILMYHRVVDDDTRFFNKWIVTKKNEFEKQVIFLKERFNVVSLPDLFKMIADGRKIPKNTLSITFDDGYKDNLSIAYPILKKHGLPFTVFVSTRSIRGTKGARPFWYDLLGYALDEKNCKIIYSGKDYDVNESTYDKTMLELMGKLKYLPYKKRDTAIADIISQTGAKIDEKKLLEEFNLSWDEINNALSDSDLLTIGGHTHNHVIFTMESDTQKEKEISTCMKIIKKETGSESYVFAYPNGTYKDYDEKTISLLKKQGIKGCVVAFAGVNTKNRFPYEARRYPVNLNDDIASFRSKLAGIEVVVPHIKRLLRI